MKKIVQDYKGCIGCGACSAVCPEFWEMDEDGRFRPKKGKKNEKGEYELEIEEKDLKCHKEAADCCPVEIIKIE